MKRTVASLLAICAGAGMIMGQGVPGQPPPPRSFHSIVPSEPEQPFNIYFEGGTPKDFLKALEESLKDLPPVIIPANAADITIPSFELRNVTLSDVFNALNILGMRENWSWQPTSRPNGSPGSAIYVLLKQESVTLQRQFPYNLPGYQQPVSSEIKVQPIHVGYLLEKYKIEDLTTAIETGWSMSGKVSITDSIEPELKYHKDTEMLLIKGYPSHLNFVTELFKQLQAPINKTSPKSPPNVTGAPGQAGESKSIEGKQNEPN
ncbi:MAG: hypothetical protein ACO1QB_03305 [Verrucomicrobiales bacterium]